MRTADKPFLPGFIYLKLFYKFIGVKLLRLTVIIMKVVHKTLRKAKLLVNKRKFNYAVRENISSNFVDLFQFSYHMRPSASEKRLGQRIEALRVSVARQYKTAKVSTFASPKSGAQLFDKQGNILSGDFVESKNAGFARTGTGVSTGIQLKKIVEAMSCKSVFELGTNTGLSGCYFLSSQTRPNLVTVEGSADLCKIAESNLALMGDSFEVIHGMFDEVIDKCISDGAQFDLAFVDGQHEEKATLHYAEKLKSIVKPGGGILFDDIYWSEGMLRAWVVISADSDFSAAYDLGSRGLCILGDGNAVSERVNFSIADYCGIPLFTRAGW